MENQDLNSEMIEAGSRFDIFLGDAIVRDTGIYYSKIPIEMIEKVEDWSYIMRVVEKIEQSACPPWTSFAVKISKCFCAIECNQAGQVPGLVYQTPMEYRPDDTITAVWQACVNFIKWFDVHKSLYAKWQEQSIDQPTT